MDFARAAVDKSKYGLLTGIRAVFRRPSIAGLVYIEAPSQSIVASVFRQAFPLIATRSLVRVPDDELLRLMTMKASWVDARLYSWVRITHGTYKNDIGMIIEEEEGTDGITVRVIPRLPPSGPAVRKGARGSNRGKGRITLRAEQRLFNVYDWPQAEKRSTLFVMKSKIFLDGLLEIILPLTHVTPLNSVSANEYMSFKTIRHIHPLRIDFFEHRIIQLKEILLQCNLQVGDRVIIEDEPSSSNVGTITEFDSDHPDTVLLKGLVSSTLVQTERRRLRKVFRIGDLVKVTGGELDGTEAWVVDFAQDNKITCAYIVKYDFYDVTMKMGMGHRRSEPSNPTSLEPIKEVWSILH